MNQCFGVGGAVWVVDGNCTVFIDTGQNDKVTRVGKTGNIRCSDSGITGKLPETAKNT